jgi:hypothetical protein
LIPWSRGSLGRDAKFVRQERRGSVATLDLFSIENMQRWQRIRATPPSAWCRESDLVFNWHNFGSGARLIGHRPLQFPPSRRGGFSFQLALVVTEPIKWSISQKTSKQPAAIVDW